MKIKPIIFIFSVVFLLNCNEKDNSKSGTKIFDTATGFSMTVPSSFPKLDSQTKEGKLKKGVKQLNKLHASELEFDLNTIEKASIFQYDEDNIFLLNTKDYSVAEQGNYNEAISELNKFAYQTQNLNFPNARLDSVTSREKIDGIEFIKYILTAKISENKTMHVVNYYHLFKDKDFTASIIFTDEELGKQVLRAFKAAKLKK